MRYGWGLAYRQPSNSGVMGEIGDLYATDGTNKVFVIDPLTWEQTKEIPISDLDGRPLNSINEIEFIQDYSNYLFANQFQQNFIYMIDLQKGKVVAKWDMIELR